MAPTHDVLIAGAGPVGLFLACELGLAGLSVLVLEQGASPLTPLKRLPFGLRGLSMPSIEAFHRRGLLTAIAASTGDPSGSAHWKAKTHQPGGHFAGIQFGRDKVAASARPDSLPEGVALPLAVELEHVERVLAARADALGVQVRRGCGVEGCEQDGESVSVRAAGMLFHGRWLVGCDGGRSAVRRAGGFDVVGTDPEFTGYSAAVELADPAGLRPGRHHTAAGMYTYAPPGTVTMVDFDRGAVHRIQPIALEHLQAVLRRVSGVDVTVKSLHLATTWTDRAFQATTYRNGRVLLAGDAAHIHSPLGGQGLNLGLGDAMNLGWKLAATIRDAAPDGLIDSYTRERHPIGAQVLDWSRAQVALMRPDRGTHALAAVFRDLIETTDGATCIARRAWGTGLRYDLGNDHPLVGSSAPDFVMTDGAALGEHLTEGRGLLVTLDRTEPPLPAASLWPERVRHVASRDTHRLAAASILVRPDGVIAWTGHATDDLADLRQAGSPWFGEPSRVR